MGDNLWSDGGGGLPQKWPDGGDNPPMGGIPPHLILPCLMLPFCCPSTILGSQNELPGAIWVPFLHFRF